MPIYTRFGDDGDTRLLGGQTTRKSDLRVELCGQLDEFNAMLGVVLAHQPDPPLAEPLLRAQSILFEIGACVAALGSESGQSPAKLLSEDVCALETSIDALDSNLPELRNFVLPGGSPLAAACHLARTLCRRCERRLVQLTDVYPDWTRSRAVLAWLNRLGDWLFVAARTANCASGVVETTWQSGQKKS